MKKEVKIKEPSDALPVEFNNVKPK